MEPGVQEHQAGSQGEEMAGQGADGVLEGQPGREGAAESCAAGLQRHQPVASRDHAPKLGRESQVRVPELQALQPVHPPVRNRHPSNDPRWKVAALGRRLIEVGMKGAEG